MEIKERIIGDVVILDISGTFMGGPPDSVEFRKTIYQLLDKGINKVVVNLAELKRMRSSGLGVLIQGLTTLRNKNSNMKLAGVGETMEGILVMTRLNTIFETYATAEEAVQSF